MITYRCHLEEIIRPRQDYRASIEQVFSIQAMGLHCFHHINNDYRFHFVTCTINDCCYFHNHYYLAAVFVKEVHHFVSDLEVPHFVGDLEVPHFVSD